ncbi:MAG: MBL fold metallo-hydrolase [Halobacteriales archaeon]
MDVTNVTAGAESFTANAYLVTGERTAMVDVGAMAGVETVVGERVEDLDAVYLTHGHRDHVAELDAVVEAFDPAVYAWADDPRRTHALIEGETVAIGDASFEVVHTPGHADDHVALVGEETVFSGDVVVHDDAAFDDGSFGRTNMLGQSRDRLIESIETLLARLPAGVEEMYAGHGGAFRGDVRAVVERALRRAKRREPKYPEEE